MGGVSKRKLFLIGLLLMFFVMMPQVQAASLESPDELEAFFDGAITLQLQQYNVPGAAVALVKDGQIIFSKGYGFADLESKTPMDPKTTLHRPGSNSKILVWTAVMQLVEQGVLDLYTDINTYLDFSIPSKIGGREAPPITLHHLMTHSAGFEEEIIELFVSGPELIQPLGDYVKNHLPARVFQPGSVMAYSNYGTTLAAYIVELQSGQDFSQYVAEHILAPLGMHSSTFVQPLPASFGAHMSPGYRYEAGRFIPGGFEYVQSYPAGALTSTTHDMALLIMGHLNQGLPSGLEEAEAPEAEGEAASEAGEVGEETDGATEVRILQEKTAELMQTQQLAAHPEIPGMTYGFIEADYQGHRVLSHGGDTMLFSTGLYFLPEENVGLYVVYNSSVTDLARRSLFQAFMDRYFAAGEPEDALTPVTPRPIADGTEKNYAGTFHSSRSNFTGVESVLRLFQPMYLSVDQDGYLNVSAYGETSRYGEIAPNLFQELTSVDKMAVNFDAGQVTRVHFPGPSTYLRSQWYETPDFIITLLAVSVLFMAVTILGWIRAIFQPQPGRRPFVAPKVLGVLFFLLFITVVILFADVLNTMHPDFGIPTVVLEPSSTLNATLILTKILMGLAGLMLLTAVYMIVTAKGSRWQRLHFALLTLSSLSVAFVLYQLNLF